MNLGLRTHQRKFIRAAREDWTGSSDNDSWWTYLRGRGRRGSMSPGTLSVWDWAGDQKCVRVVFINWQWWLKLKTAHFTGIFEVSRLRSGTLSASRRPDPWLSKKHAVHRFIQNQPLFQKSVKIAPDLCVPVVGLTLGASWSSCSFREHLRKKGKKSLSF